MHSRRHLIASAFILLGACDPMEKQPDQASTRLLDPGQRLATIGAPASDTAAGSALGIVLAARITPGGAHVVVLDAVPPFVKVFDRSGGLRSAFLTQGGGPLESVGPSAIAVAGDSAILVADVAGGIATFDFDGKPTGRIPSLGFIPLAAMEACGAWMFYGPRFSAGSSGEAHWLHRLPAGAADAGALESFVHDSLASSALGVGKPYGFVATENGAVVRHDLGSTPSLVRWTCGNGTPAVSPLPAVAVGERPPPLTRTEGGMMARVEPGMASPVGLASSRAGTVVANRIATRGESAVTVMHLLRGNDVATIRLPGDYVIRDSRPGTGVLVGTIDPVPQLFLLSESAFDNLFLPQ